MLSASTHCFSVTQIVGGEKSSSTSLFKSIGFVIGRAMEQHDLLAADHLVRRMYAWRGYLTKHPQHPRSLHRAADQATLVAWQNGELAATLTLSRDNEHGLLCESLYSKEISELRTKQVKICEFSRFAIDPAFRSPKLLDSFFRAAYQFSCSQFGATDAVVEVNPRHSRYYERELGFATIGPRRVCPRVDAPAILLHRNLHHPLPKAWAKPK
ncbi:MAG: hypothetical protein U0989_01505 [Azonexus sp.]|nr:hypothetical protein [Azonexus sp.]MDZ4313441.1 hypothetical protein [Azonexus sp.]